MSPDFALTSDQGGRHSHAPSFSLFPTVGKQSSPEGARALLFPLPRQDGEPAAGAFSAAILPHGDRAGLAPREAPAAPAV